MDLPLRNSSWLVDEPCDPRRQMAPLGVMLRGGGEAQRV